MITKKIFKGIQGKRISKVALIAVLLLSGTSLFAQVSGENSGETQFPYLEVFGSVGGIFVLVMITWFFASRQSKNDSGHEYHPSDSRKHYSHPHDPHFNKIKRKTS